MPIYEYKCIKCSFRFEMRKRINENGSGFCPQCGNEAYRLFSPPPIIFKGSGFYVTDNRKGNNGFSNRDDGDKSNSESASETKRL